MPGHTPKKPRKLISTLVIIASLVTAFAVSDNPRVAELRRDFLGRLGYEQIDERLLLAPGGTDDRTGGDDGGVDTEQGGNDDFGSETLYGTKVWESARLTAETMPMYEGDLYIKVKGGAPDFPLEAYEGAGLVHEGDKWTSEEGVRGKISSKSLNSYEYYGELDKLGRCSLAYGCLSPETMPEEYEERGDIAGIHPSGWTSGQGWERAHLIAWSLSAENANERNLVTGTHSMNYDSMRPFEEEVMYYIHDTGNHVLYMAKPWFMGDELIPRGVQLAAWSVEDRGKGVSFNVYCFNAIRGADIDYVTGVVTSEEQAAQDARVYVLNTGSRKFHYPTCEGASKIAEHNRKEVTATRFELTTAGYVPCGYCQP